MPTTISTERPTPDLAELLLQPEIQQAITDLVQQLPKLKPLLSLLSTGVEAASEVLSDADMLGGVESIVREKTKPFQHAYQETVEAVREARNRAEKDGTYIGIFGVLRLLKDPNIQYALRFIQSMSDVASERNLFTRSPQSETSE